MSHFLEKAGKIFLIDNQVELLIQLRLFPLSTQEQQ